MSQTGRPSTSRARTLEIIEEFVEAGETDAVDGGVATTQIARECDLTRLKATAHCRELVAEGKLEKVRGISPKSRVRRSYLPTEVDR